MPKPIIGIPAYINMDAAPDLYGLNKSYIQGVLAAGGLPVLLPIAADCGELLGSLSGLQGVLLSGGGDLAPQRFGEEPLPKTGGIDCGRDEFEYALFAHAYERRLPILGICRGFQLINVALGGTLVQDIPTARPDAVSHVQNERYYEKHHTITLETGSLMQQIFGKGEILVNSLHHQAIGRLAASLIVTAKALDGVIEAFQSHNAGRYLHAVQFHPEWMREHYPEFDGIFSSFIAACQT